MGKSTSNAGLSAGIDPRVRAAFLSAESQPVPDHILGLVEELETARRTGCLASPEQAALVAETKASAGERVRDRVGLHQLQQPGAGAIDPALDGA